MGLKISSSGLSHLKKWEGLRLTVYDDAGGYDTIGYGHLIQPGENFSGGITKSQAEALLQQDMVRFENAVNNTIQVPLTQNQFDALVSYAFNIGVSAFSSGNLARLINQGASESEIRNWWITRYVTSNGIYVPGLYNRRVAEADLFFSTSQPLKLPGSVAFMILSFLVVFALFKIFI